MKQVLNVFSKFFVANVAVIIAIMMLPVFLITDDISFFDPITDYLFNHRS